MYRIMAILGVFCAISAQAATTTYKSYVLDRDVRVKTSRVRGDRWEHSKDGSFYWAWFHNFDMHSLLAPEPRDCFLKDNKRQSLCFRSVAKGMISGGVRTILYAKLSQDIFKGKARKLALTNGLTPVKLPKLIEVVEALLGKERGRQVVNAIFKVIGPDATLAQKKKAVIGIILQREDKQILPKVDEVLGKPMAVKLHASIKKSVTEAWKLVFARYFEFKNWPMYAIRSGSTAVRFYPEGSKDLTFDRNGKKVHKHYAYYKTEGPFGKDFIVKEVAIYQDLKGVKSIKSMRFDKAPGTKLEGVKLKIGTLHLLNRVIDGQKVYLLTGTIDVIPSIDIAPGVAKKYVSAGIIAIFKGMFKAELEQSSQLPDNGDDDEE